MNPPQHASCGRIMVAYGRLRLADCNIGYRTSPPQCPLHVVVHHASVRRQVYRSLYAIPQTQALPSAHTQILEQLFQKGASSYTGHNTLPVRCVKHNCRIKQHQHHELRNLTAVPPLRRRASRVGDDDSRDAPASVYTPVPKHTLYNRTPAHPPYRASRVQQPGYTRVCLSSICLRRSCHSYACATRRPTD